jgi:hypothetical protein
MSQKQNNADKLKQFSEKVNAEKKELALARELAIEATNNLKLENAKAAKQARELMTSLNLALATFNAKLDEGKADNEKDTTRFTHALEAMLSKEAVANITDEQMQALGDTITVKLDELKKLLPSKKTSLDMGSFKIELADKLVTDKDVKKIVDAIPDKISGTVELAEYGSKQRAQEYLNVRLTNGIEFIDEPRKGGGFVVGSPGGGAGGSTTVTDPTDGMILSRQDVAGEPMYFGYEDADNFVIVEIDITVGTTLYFTGTGSVSDGTNWTGRAGHTYVEANALY